MKGAHYFNQRPAKNNFLLSLISQCVLNKANFAWEKTVNMKIVTGKGAMKPSDLFISTAISFKSAYLCCLLLLQLQNMTAAANQR